MGFIKKYNAWEEVYMKYCLTFACRQPVEVPVQYCKILHAALLTWLDDSKYASFLHDDEFQRNSYQMYTFSELMGQREYDQIKNKFVYYGQIQIILSFATDESNVLIFKNYKEQRPLRLGREFLDFVGCVPIEEKETDFCVVDTVSPITIYSTYEKEDGRKKTYYYAPFDEGFSELIREDLIRKYSTVYHKLPQNDAFEITAPIPEQLYQATVWYNNFFIRGWHGRFELKGSPELIKFGLLSGLGQKNPIGLGCIVRI